MIPAKIYAGNPSPGEKEIFRRLADDPETHDWIVLHSLDIVKHQKRLSGEVDFVIIVPKKGVLCLEVKATSSVRRERGLWYYGTDPIPDRRGPFKQSSEAMHSVRTGLAKQDKSLGRIPFWSAVIFPYLDFNVGSGEWHQWQVIDNRSFRRKPISSLVLNVLNEARKHLEESRTAWFDASGNEPSAAQCKLIANLLRPDFEIYESPRSRLERFEQEVKRYTEEQFAALDAMTANHRVVFSGPAGTGKTVLAIEAARRSQAEGRHVLLVCFNRLLGSHFETETAALQPKLVACSLHKYLLSIAGRDVEEQAHTGDFWLEELPRVAIDRLLADTSESRLFDEIIIDEAQDLLRTSFLDFFDLSLRGGLRAGQWKLFGDFEKQAIYGSNTDISIEEAISTRLGKAPRYFLRVNCRNTPRIASLVHLLGDLNPEYSRILRPDDGVEPKITYYVNDEDQKRRLLQIIDKLKNDGFRASDIAILSTKAPDRSIAAMMNPVALVKLAPFPAKNNDCIGFASIYAFKGMESPAVIVTDVEAIYGDQARSIFYIAMTRALHRLYILANDSTKQDVLRAILGT